jgi:hypothetical protein
MFGCSAKVDVATKLKNAEMRMVFAMSWRFMSVTSRKKSVFE